MLWLLNFLEEICKIKAYFCPVASCLPYHLETHIWTLDSEVSHWPDDPSRLVKALVYEWLKLGYRFLVAAWVGGAGYSHLDVELNTMGCRKGVARNICACSFRCWGKTGRERTLGCDGKNMSSEALSLNLSLTTCIPLEHSKSFLRLSFPFL